MALAAWQATIVDESGEIQGLAQAMVLVEATGAPAALFSDRDGASPIGNPVTADSSGFVRFYAAGNAYRITATLGAFSRVWRHVPIGTLGERDEVPSALVKYDITAAEIAAGVTPVNANIEAGYVERYGNNTVPGTTDMSAALAAAIAQAAVGGEPVRARTVLHIASATNINVPFVAAPAKQVFSATSIVAFSAGSVDAVYPDWWGSASGTLATARTSVSGKYIPVRLLAKEYAISTTLVITDDGAAIIGCNQSKNTEGGVFDGSVIRYTASSGTAILVGQAPDVDGNFLSKLTLSGFTLRVTENTDIALRLWHTEGQSLISGITVRGNSDNDGSDNIGIKVDGCINTTFERCIVFGQGLLGTGTSLLENGIFITTGDGGSPSTTLKFFGCNTTQCRFGVRVTGAYAAFYSCTNESSHNAGLLLDNSSVVRLYDPWFEDVGVGGFAAVRLQGTDTALLIESGRFDIGNRQYFVQCEDSSNLVTFVGTITFSSTHATPTVILTGGTQPTVGIFGDTIHTPTAANHVIWGGGLADNKLFMWRGGKLSTGAAAVEASAVFDCQSISKVFLPPRMTSTERDAITSPAAGGVIYNLTTSKLQVRSGGAWVDLH